MAASSGKQMTDAFNEFQQHLDQEQALREEIRVLVTGLEQYSRNILTVLQAIHQKENVNRIPEICKEGQSHFPVVHTKFAELAKKVPKDQYYRFNDHWRFVIQRLVMLSALTIYLQENRLASLTEVAKMLGVGTKCGTEFHLDLEDYLCGLLSMANELSRFAINSVTAGDYRRPIQLASFLAELNMGFRMLNLKNDSLRKRFDALKYDIKKVEEVVYDLSIRGLRSDSDPAPQ